MQSYKEYYEYCKKQYSGKYVGRYPLEDLTFLVSSVDNHMIDSVKNIYNYSNMKIKNRQNLFDVGHQNIIKLDNYSDCDDVSYLGNYLGQFLEENVYNSYCIVEAVLIYESLSNDIKRTSWLWHYDDNVNEQLKIMVYLNDVNENNGGMRVMSHNNMGFKLKSSKFSPDKELPQVYPKSRIPEHKIKKLNNGGFEDKIIIGSAGTLCLFDPNIIHKATIPTQKPNRLCILYNFRPFHKKVENRINNKFTRTWSNLGDIKRFDFPRRQL